MGYDYMVFGDFHFRDDLQYEDAVPMLTRLMKLSEELGLEFGVKELPILSRLMLPEMTSK